LENDLSDADRPLRPGAAVLKDGKLRERSSARTGPVCSTNPIGAMPDIRGIRGRRSGAFMSAVESYHAGREDFAALLEESFTRNEALEGTVIKGKVVAIEKDMAIIDVGLKTEGRVALKEFTGPGRDEELKVGDEVEVYLDRIENALGEAVISRDKARREESWVKLEKAFEAREKVMGNIFNTVKGGYTVVKNITEYGAFVDLGGIDGLLHVTDMAWRRVNHPSEVVTIGQTVKVKIIKINQETHRISLGIKQLLADPWDGIAARYPVGTRLKGRVTNITDYGAFVEVEPGIEGLIHVSEMSWTKKNVHPGKIVSTSQEVDVAILEVDQVKRRISLGLKQTLRNPWEVFAEQHPSGAVVEGEVKNKTEFGLFLGLEGDIDGMIHLSDLDWNRPGEQVIEEYKKGDMLQAVVLDVDVEKERISLGLKQLGGDPFVDAGEFKKGQVVTCEIVDVKDGGLDVKIAGTDMTTFIKRAEIARDRAEQRPERFAAGEKVDARVILFDKKARKIQVSIKALEMAEEKEAMAQYGSADSGASLGDILGAALKKAGTDKK
jgi:ribosomal protein S1